MIMNEYISWEQFEVENMYAQFRRSPHEWAQSEYERWALDMYDRSLVRNSISEPDAEYWY